MTQKTEPRCVCMFPKGESYRPVWIPESVVMQHGPNCPRRAKERAAKS